MFTEPGFSASTVAASAVTTGPWKVTPPPAEPLPVVAQAPIGKITRIDASLDAPAQTRAIGAVVVIDVLETIVPGRSTDVRVPSPKIGSAEVQRTVTCVFAGTVGPKRTPVSVTAAGVSAVIVLGVTVVIAGPW